MRLFFNFISNSSAPENPVIRGDRHFLLQLSRLSIPKILPLICVLALLFCLPQSTGTSSVLKRWSELNIYQKLRADCLNYEIRDAQTFALTANFLANQKISDPVLTGQFRDSGLSHLLALSGGQTHPAAMFVSQFFLFLFLTLSRLHGTINFARLSRLLRFSAGLIQTAILMFLVGLYQSSGALNRSLSQHIVHCSSNAAILSQTANGSGNSRHLKSFCTAAPWVLGFLLHRNPVGDLSFLLSALGAATGRVTNTSLGLLTGFFEESDPDEAIQYTGLLQFLQNICLAVLSVAATSALMCLLTWPLWTPENIYQKVQANILAGPCVMLIVTPAALGVCLGALTGFAELSSVSHAVLEFGVRLLAQIAHIFSESHLPRDLSGTEHALSANGREFAPAFILTLQYVLLVLTAEILKIYRCRKQT
ncbi:MAG: hypothetical protein EBR09_01925 [Proteobacteria bacterium]|nr:hypothetical protein [Pseudomonadota bacterium]